VVDFVCVVKENVTVEKVNAALKEAANSKLKGILQFCEEELVSIDFLGNNHSSIVDAPSTKVIEGNMVKVLSWYDNEWGYSSRVVDLIKFIMK
jgi:glyceraldehyde 3-phosphate dehydrogenase